MTDFQTRSKGCCLVTVPFMSFAPQNLLWLKRQHRTEGFSVTDGFASILFIPVPYAKIRFPLLLATGSLHLLSSFATLL